MKKSKVFILFFITILLIMTTGCYNKNELDNLAYVVALGADIGSGENLEITYQIAVPLKISSKDGQTGKENFITYTVSSPSLYMANSKVNAITSKEVNLSHVKLILYSEELAKNDLEGHINSLISNPSIRPRTTVAICKNKAKDFLKNISPDLESSPARYYELLFTAHEYTSGSAPSELLEFFAATTSLDKDPAILFLKNDANKNDSSQEQSNSNSDNQGASKEQSSGNSDNQGAPKEQNNNPSASASQKQIEGLAIFNGSKMVGEISNDQILPHLILKNELKTGEILVNDVIDSNEHVSITIKKISKNKIKVDFDSEIPKVDIEIKLSSQLRSSSSTTDYLNEKNKEQLTNNINMKIEKDIKDYLTKTQELGADTIGIGKYARKNFLTWNEFEKSRWKEKYKNAEININVSTNLDVSRLMYHRLPTS